MNARFGLGAKFNVITRENGGDFDDISTHN